MTPLGMIASLLVFACTVREYMASKMWRNRHATTEVACSFVLALYKIMLYSGPPCPAGFILFLQPTPGLM
jgi:hypothetical protein